MGVRDAVEWPVPETPDQTLRTVLRNCAVSADSHPGIRRPRWSIVSDLTTHGSTASAKLCRWAGVDPHEVVVQRK